VPEYTHKKKHILMQSLVGHIITWRKIIACLTDFFFFGDLLSKKGHFFTIEHSKRYGMEPSCIRGHRYSSIYLPDRGDLNSSPENYFFSSTPWHY